MVIFLASGSFPKFYTLRISPPAHLDMFIKRVASQGVPFETVLSCSVHMYFAGDGVRLARAFFSTFSGGIWNDNMVFCSITIDKKVMWLMTITQISETHQESELVPTTEHEASQALNRICEIAWTDTTSCYFHHGFARSADSIVTVPLAVLVLTFAFPKSASSIGFEEGLDRAPMYRASAQGHSIYRALHIGALYIGPYIWGPYMSGAPIYRALLYKASMYRALYIKVYVYGSICRALYIGAQNVGLYYALPDPSAPRGRAAAGRGRAVAGADLRIV